MRLIQIDAVANPPVDGAVQDNPRTLTTPFALYNLVGSERPEMAHKI
jgi:hypothetical protein